MKLNIFILFLFISSCYVVKRISSYKINNLNSVSHIIIKKYDFDSNHITSKDTVINDKKSIIEILNILNKNKKTHCKISKKYMIKIHYKNKNKTIDTIIVSKNLCRINDYGCFLLTTNLEFKLNDYFIVK